MLHYDQWIFMIFLCTMTFNLNKVMLMGRCTASVETKRIEGSNLSVVNFTVVTNRKFKNSRGELVTESEYTKCTAYGNSADILGKYLTKGKKVFIEGRLKTRKWNDAAGNPRQSTEVIVDNFIFLDPRAEGEEVEEHIEEEVTLDNETPSFVNADNHPTF